MSLEDRKVIFDFQFKAVVEAANALLKLTSFYFLVVGASVGYIFSAAIEDIVVSWMVVGLLGISFFFLIVCLALSYGVVMGLVDIRRGLAALDPHISEETNIVEFMRRGGRVSILITCCCTAVILIIATGLFAYYWHEYNFIELLVTANKRL